MIKKYKQSEILKCSATIRPSYCQYSGNVCCYSCDKNDECTKISIDKKMMRPCRETLTIKMMDSSLRDVEFLGSGEICEFSI